MAEDKKFKPDKTILSRIQSHDEAVNLAVIDQLRNVGKAGYLPYLVRLARLTPHQTVHVAVFRLLNDLKNQSAAPFIADAIRDETNRPILKKLVESCWQNRLDFSQHLHLFTDLLIHETDEISFEAFTVIENMETMPGDTALKKEVGRLEKHLGPAGETRKYFIREAIKAISSVMD